jgi:hypothetical protein
MTDEQKNEYLKKFEADLITPAEVALWKRGASNAGYHYLGCAKTFALMGKPSPRPTYSLSLPSTVWTTDNRVTGPCFTDISTDRPRPTLP